MQRSMSFIGPLLLEPMRSARSVRWPSAIKSTGLTVVVSTPVQEAAEATVRGRLPLCAGRLP